MTTSSPECLGERNGTRGLWDNQFVNDRIHGELSRFAELASLTCETPVSVIWIKDANRLWFTCNGQSQQVADLSYTAAFCRHAIASNHLFEVNDSFTDPRFVDHVHVAGYPTIRFYAGHPLIDGKGHILGTLCVIDSRPRQLNDMQKQSLRLLADAIIDLTIAGKQKEALQEKRFQAFFEHSLGLMCMYDLEGRILSVNRAGAEKLGYTPAELVGQSLSSLSPIKNVSKFAAYLRRIARIPSMEGEFETITKSGKVQAWLFSSVRESDGEGQVYVMTNAIEITGRRELENDLRKTKETLEQTSTLARIGGWEVDMARQSLYWSPITKEIHEVDQQFVPNIKKAITFYKAGASRNRIKKLLRRAREEGLPWDEELQIVTAKGHEKWVKAVGHIERKNDRIVRIYGTFQDISERVNARQELIGQQARLAAFIEHAPVAIAMLDSELRYIAVSRRWMEDHVIAGPLIGKHHYDFFPAILSEWKVQHQQALAGAVITEEQHRWRPAWSDHDRYMYREVRPWFDHTGRIGGIILLTQDTTEAYLQQEALKKAMQAAEDANRAKSDFLANMSHEIRTPLNGVIGFTELTLKTDLSETQRCYLSIINQSAATLRYIINDILDFSKIEAGQLELFIDRCDLFELGGDVADIVAFQATQKGLEVLLNLSPRLPRYVKADMIRLKQVLVNLVSNAVKFTEQGEIELKVVGLEEKAGRTLFRFAIKDTGIGIPNDKRDEIFVAFKQADNLTTEKFGGTGLGLTISNRLLALMGSNLHVESTPNGGSLFYFDVWLATESRSAQPTAVVEGGRRRVLLVDDNQRSRSIISEMLTSQHVLATPAASAIEALELMAVADNHFDAVIVDLHMPGMDGIAFLEQIRALGWRDMSGHPQVIVLHPPTMDDRTLDKLVALNVEHRLVKPLKIDHLNVILGRMGWHTHDRPLKFNLLDECTTLHPLTVLLVEDNLVNMLLARTILARILPHGNIITAKDGNEGVSNFTLHKPDLILMDIRMPEMNGYEATRQIRELPSGANVPIIALTAGNTREERQRAVDAGMNDFVAKPFNEAELFKVITQWC